MLPKSDSPGEPEADQNAGEQGPAKPQETPDLDISKWVSVQFAPPRGDMPLFVLRYFEYTEGSSANLSADKELLIDLRGSNPEVVAAADFHCNSRTGYGAPDSYRTLQRDFYLIADKPARPAWAANSPPDLATWAQSLHQSAPVPTKFTMVPSLGPTTFLARYADFLPHADVLLFASPGEGSQLNARFSLVIIPDEGEPSIQSVEKWNIGGEESTQQRLDWPAPQQPEFSAPVDDGATYNVRALEDRPVFHALQATLA